LSFTHFLVRPWPFSLWRSNAKIHDNFDPFGKLV
jgi:hypothetical protein